jgi:hypothetical protein
MFATALSFLGQRCGSFGARCPLVLLVGKDARRSVIKADQKTSKNLRWAGKAHNPPEGECWPSQARIH